MGAEREQEGSTGHIPLGQQKAPPSPAPDRDGVEPVSVLRSVSPAGVKPGKRDQAGQGSIEAGAVAHGKGRNCGQSVGVGGFDVEWKTWKLDTQGARHKC